MAGNSRAPEGRSGVVVIVASRGESMLPGAPHRRPIPGNRGSAHSFRAKPGLRYFIGTLTEETGGQFHWIPATDDETEGKVAPLPDVSPQTPHAPATVTSYI